MQGWKYPNLLCMPLKTGQPPVSSHETWSQLYGSRKSLRQGIIPSSCRRDAGRSGAEMYKMHKRCWRRPCHPPPALETCRLIEGTNTGEWFIVLSSTVNEMEMGGQKWRNDLLLFYSTHPPYLPSQCGGWNATLSICHALDCKKGGLITTCHNELCDGVANLTGKAFISSHVYADPLIHPGCSVWDRKAQRKGSLLNNLPMEKEMLDQKGGLLIRYLWQRGTGSIHYMCVVNTDALSHQNKFL